MQTSSPAISLLFFIGTVLILTLPAGADCPSPPPAQRDLIADSYYDNPPVNSHIDPSRLAAYNAAVKPLESYLHTVARMASSGDTVCTLRWLVAWAEADALLGHLEKEQAHYERKWLLAGLALSYAKIRDRASSDQRASIDAWLQALAEAVRTHSDNHKGVRNNHYYWEGLAVGAVGATTGNSTDTAWARTVFRAAEADITADGTLPLEMKRGSRALHYHIFSVEPLVMLESLLDEHSSKLSKLVRYCIAGARNPATVVTASGEEQVPLQNGDMDWLTIYLRHAPNSGIDPQIGYRHERPDVTKLGGDLSKPNPLEHIPAK